MVVFPFDGLGILVVFADVAHQLSPQALRRGKPAAGYDITLNAGEPVLHLFLPRPVRGSGHLSSTRRLMLERTAWARRCRVASCACTPWRGTWTARAPH